jgi:hypothetical protein
VPAVLTLSERLCTSAVRLRLVPRAAAADPLAAPGSSSSMSCSNGQYCKTPSIRVRERINRKIDQRRTRSCCWCYLVRADGALRGGLVVAVTGADDGRGPGRRVWRRLQPVLSLSHRLGHGGGCMRPREEGEVHDALAAGGRDGDVGGRQKAGVVLTWQRRRAVVDDGAMQPRHGVVVVHRDVALVDDLICVMCVKTEKAALARRRVKSHQHQLIKEAAGLVRYGCIQGSISHHVFIVLHRDCPIYRPSPRLEPPHPSPPPNRNWSTHYTTLFLHRLCCIIEKLNPPQHPTSIVDLPKQVTLGDLGSSTTGLACRSPLPVLAFLDI